MLFFFTFKYKLLQTFLVADSGEGPGGGPTPPLIFRLNWGPKGWKFFLGDQPPPPYLRVGMTPPTPPPPLSQGLDSALISKCVKTLPYVSIDFLPNFVMSFPFCVVLFKLCPLIFQYAVQVTARCKLHGPDYTNTFIYLFFGVDRARWTKKKKIYCLRGHSINHWLVIYQLPREERKYLKINWGR